MSEVNFGPLPDGGFWAGFCSNPECNVLGCPGDCDEEELTLVHLVPVDESEDEW